MVSHNSVIASLVFFVALTLTLPTEARWLKKQVARQKARI